MKEVATALLFDRDGRFVIYLRDDKPTIPFPNHWDLFGGHVEIGESAIDALYREIEEELRIEPLSVEFFKTYLAETGDASPNRKHVFVVRISEAASELTLYEGQELRAIDLKEWPNYKWANILGTIVGDYAAVSPSR